MIRIIILFLIFFNLSSIVIAEELTINESESVKDRLENNDCFPECRKGYICHEGNCISKCNPPCPEGMECSDNGECFSILSKKKEVIEKVYGVKKVTEARLVNQGFIINTNRNKSILYINDDTITFDKKLFLQAETGSYKLCVKANKTYEKYDSENIENDETEILNMPLRRSKLFIGLTTGPGIYNDNFYQGFNISAGVGLIKRHLISLQVAVYTSISDTMEYLGDTKDSFYPDYAIAKTKGFNGYGINYGYTFNIKKRLVITPQLGFGYWKHEISTFLKKRDKGETIYKKIDNTEEVELKRFYARPTLDFMFGSKIVRFKGNVSTFLGEELGPFTIGLGVAVCLL